MDVTDKQFLKLGTVGVLKPYCTTAMGLIRALTDARPIKPTSTCRLSTPRPNPGKAPLIEAEILIRQPQPPQ